MADNVMMCPKCDREVAAQVKRCPTCGFDLEHYRRLMNPPQTEPVWPDISVEEIKRALLVDTRRQILLGKVYIIGSAIVTVIFVWLNLSSGAYGPPGQIDFSRFSESATSLVVPLMLIGAVLYALGLISNLPYVWQLLIKIAEQQAEVLNELRRDHTSEPTPPEP